MTWSSASNRRCVRRFELSMRLRWTLAAVSFPDPTLVGSAEHIVSARKRFDTAPIWTDSRRRRVSGTRPDRPYRQIHRLLVVTTRLQAEPVPASPVEVSHDDRATKYRN